MTKAKGTQTFCGNSPIMRAILVEGRERCRKAERISRILGISPQELGVRAGMSGPYLEPSIKLAGIFEGIKLTSNAVYVKRISEKKLAELNLLISELYHVRS